MTAFMAAQPAFRQVPRAEVAGVEPGGWGGDAAGRGVDLRQRGGQVWSWRPRSAG